MRWIAIALVLGGCKPDAETCTKACLNFAKLAFDEKLNSDLLAVPAGEQDAFRAEAQKKWVAIESDKTERGRENCEIQCRTDSRRADAECMASATSTVQARACVGM